MATVLAESLFSSSSQWSFKILLCDMLESPDDVDYVLSLENIEVIPLFSLLAYADFELEQMCFKYKVIEMNTAIKPFFFKYLMDMQYDKIVYLDPDILITDTLDEISSLLDSYEFILTPHILTPIPDDGKMRSEIDILKSGTFNLGFLALKNCPHCREMVDWWHSRLKNYCYMQVAEGLHVDQKWIDFIPAFYENVKILQDKTYNVAYWNLHERVVKRDNKAYYVDSRPLKFYHFSGLMFENINTISKHQTRFSLDDFPDLRHLFKEYKKRLKNHGFMEARKNSYWFDYLPGTRIKIPEFIRANSNEIFSEIGNVYNPDNILRFVQYTNRQIDGKNPPVTRLWNWVYQKRNDVQAAFPDMINNDKSRESFIAWIDRSGRREYHYHESFHGLEPSLSIGQSQFGMNIFGYFMGIFGVAESGRNLFKVTLLAGIPFTLISVDSNVHEVFNEESVTASTMKKFLSQTSPYNINLIIVNADQIPSLFGAYKESFRKDQYNIGFWAWELEQYFPFEKAFDFIDEIWYFSEFACRVYRRFTNKPVTKITYPFYPTWDKITPREIVWDTYNVNEDDFVFIFHFDFQSSFERKNPEGLVKAFIRAFPEKDTKVKLVLKSLHSELFPEESKTLRKALSQDHRILWLDLPMTKNEVMSLINAADCYVSLHRSEGFGIGLAEAMFLGKCVIGTAYGGNLEFMTPENSLLVDYSMKEIVQDFGPYKKGVLWADPNIDTAVKHLRYVFNNPEIAKKIGETAASDIRKILSPRKTVIEILRRCSEIGRKKNG